MKNKKGSKNIINKHVKRKKYIKKNRKNKSVNIHIHKINKSDMR